MSLKVIVYGIVIMMSLILLFMFLTMALTAFEDFMNDYFRRGHRDDEEDEEDELNER